MTSAPRDSSTTSGWVIGRVGGAPVVLTWSWLVAPIVITLIFEPRVRAYAPSIGAATYGVALAFALLLLVSVFLHELAHAMVARARGQEVQELAITVWGGRTSFASPAPTPGTSALVAFVGPLANVVVAIGCWVILRGIEGDTIGALVLEAGMVSNVFVAAFNLLPGLPMDGGYLLEALVWRVSGNRERGTLAAGWFGRLVVVALGVWVLLPALMEGRAPDLVNVGWSALIGAFLWSGAGEAIRSARAALRVGDLGLDQIGVSAVGVPSTTTLADGVQRAMAAGASAIVLLDPEGRPCGYVDKSATDAVPEQSWAVTPLAAVTVVIPASAVVDARLTGSELVRAVGAVARLSPVLVAVEPGPGAGVVRALVRVDAVVAALGAR